MKETDFRWVQKYKTLTNIFMELEEKYSISEEE